MDDGEVVDRLRRLLKLSGYEAKAYLALLKLGAAKPLEVARAAGIPSQRIYDVLQSLRRRGLVVEKSPGMFTVTEPREAFNKIAEEMVLNTLRAAEEVRRLGVMLSRVARNSGREELGIVYGVEPSIAQAISAAAECDAKPIFTVYKVADRLSELWPLLRRLLESLRHGAIVALPSTVRVDERFIEEAKSYGVEILRADHPFLDMMIACDTVLIGLPSREHEAVTVVVRNSEFAEAVARRVREYLSGAKHL